MSFAKIFEAALEKRKQGKHQSSLSSSSSPPKLDASVDADRPKVDVPKPARAKTSKVSNQPSNTNNDDRAGAEKKSRRKRQRKKSVNVNSPSKRVKKDRPTKEVLELSEQLKSLCRQKRLDQALQLYWDSNENMRDEYNACMLVDCCARCGVVTEAETVVRKLDHPNVEVQTALLKCYAKVGQMSKAQSLFEEMCKSAQKPNVRTLNTVLRGCLWTPASIVQSKPVGGVVTSEKVWQLYRQAVSIETLDTSSYEYSITLLCQNLDVERAKERIEELQSTRNVRIKGKASFVGGDEHVMETLAVVYLALSRAYALLGLLDDTLLSCQRVLSAVSGCRVRHVAQGETSNITEGKSKTTAVTTGGKKAWKTQAKDDQSERRVESNTAYRDHRLKEIETEARAILKMRGKQCQPLNRQDLWKRLLNSLFFFHEGETNTVSLTAATWYSFGGRIAGKTLGCDSMKHVKQDAVRKDGAIDFKRVFGDSKRPLDVELGSGYGDWIVRTAASNLNRNHVAVELRADRAYQIFTKAALEPSGALSNVCVVGSDACSFLRNRVRPASISTIFVHHPEPPTQTYGSSNSDLEAIIDGSGVEPAHMLCSDTLVAAAKSLEANGKIAVVTDNRSYGRLVCATMTRVLRKDKSLFRGPTTSEIKSSGLILRRNCSSELLFADDQFGVALYEKQHNTSGPALSSGGAAADTTSWFDRLWRTGLSSHAEKQKRFVVLMYRRT